LPEVAAGGGQVAERAEREPDAPAFADRPESVQRLAHLRLGGRRGLPEVQPHLGGHHLGHRPQPRVGVGEQAGHPLGGGAVPGAVPEDPGQRPDQPQRGMGAADRAAEPFRLVEPGGHLVQRGIALEPVEGREGVRQRAVFHLRLAGQRQHVPGERQSLRPVPAEPPVPPEPGHQRDGHRLVAGLDRGADRRVQVVVLGVQPA